MDELADKYGSDKGGNNKSFANQMKAHGYSKIYPELVSKLKTIDVVLEVGIAGGASLRLWAELFPGARIIGMDIDPDSLIEEGSISSFWVDQLDVTSLRNAKRWLMQQNANPVDFVIDDGLHTAEAAIKTFENFWPMVRPGGCYVIEDVFDSELLQILDLLTANSIDFDVFTVRTTARKEDWFIVSMIKPDEARAC